MRLFEDFFDDIESDEMLKSEDEKSFEYEYIMLLEQEVFIPDIRLEEVSSWKVWDMLFVRFINLIDNIKFIDTYEAEVRYIIPEYIHYLAMSSNISKERMIDEIKNFENKFVNK